MSWMMIVIAYLAVGILLVFIGPAATSLERERMTIVGHPVWKQWAFFFIMATSVVAFWPVLVPSAHRSTRDTNSRRMMPYVPVLSEAGRLRIHQARNHGPRTLSFAEYERIGDDLPYDDALLLRRMMDRLGYTVDAAETDTGERIPVSLTVISEIGSPIKLSRPNSEDIGGPTINGSWSFTNGADAWEHLAGRAGEAVVKDGVLVKIVVRTMN